MITQTEIIVLAIKQLDAQIENWRVQCKGEENIFRQVTADLQSKRETLYTLYLIQTGENYN